MPTTYTPRLKFALPATGELSGTWGDVVNNNITSIIEQAIAGLATIDTWTSNSKTLTVNDGTPDEARCAMLVFATGAGGTALTAAGTVICPAVTKLYIAKNSAAFPVTLRTASGTGISVPPNQTMILMCDGTNVVSAASSLVGGPSWTAANVPGTSIDVSSAFYFSKTISANTTFTVTNVPPSGTAAYFFLELTNGGAFNTVFWSGVEWANNSPVSLTPFGIDLLEFSTRDGGATWQGRRVGTYGAYVSSPVFTLNGECFGGGNSITQIVNDTQGNLYAVGGDGALAVSTTFANQHLRADGWTYNNVVADMVGYNGTSLLVTSPTGQVLVVSTTTSTGASRSVGGQTAILDLNYRIQFVSPGFITTSIGNTALCGAVTTNLWCIGAAASLVASSNNGLNWTVTSLTGIGFSTSVVGMAFGGSSVFAAMGSNAAIATSPDGVTWTYRGGLISAWTSATATGIESGNGIFMAIGLSGKLATSTDGITWTDRTAALTATAWSTTATPAGNRPTWTGTAWVLVSTNGITAVSTDNGVTWTANTALQTTLGGTVPQTYAAIATVCPGASGTLMVGGAYGMFAYSPDNGTSWVLYEGPARPLSNLVSSKANINTLAQTWALNWNGSLFMYANRYGLATSPDGVTWTPRMDGLRNRWSANNIAQGQVTGIAFGNGTHVLVAHNSRIFTSANNGVTWTYQNGYFASVSNTTGMSVAFGNSTFVLVGSVARTARSVDNGVTWTGSTIPTFSGQTNTISFGNGVFLAGGTSGRVSTTPDGATWTASTTNLTATGWGTTTVQASTFGNGIFVIGGAFGAIATSPDGATWTYRNSLVSAWSAYSSGTTPTLFGLTWTGVEFVAVGQFFGSQNTPYGLVATSPDGITWTDRTALVPSGPPTSNQSIRPTGFRGVAGNSTVTLIGGANSTLVIR